MDNEELLNRVTMNQFPKVELHRHLEGSFCLNTLYDIAMKNNISDVPKDKNQFIENAQFPKNHKPDFLLFLSKFRNDWYDSHDDIYNLTYQSILNFKEENLFFIELRFSPEHFCLKNNFDRIEVSRIIIDAAKKAAKKIGTHIKFIVTFNRNKQTNEKMLSLYRRLREANLSDIVGMDLAGDEIANPPEEFINLFDVIHGDGVGITIHAGEVTTPKQVWDAINLLHAKRIGHGTISVEDEALQEAFIEKEIYLEQCPVSNYYTGSCVDTPNHPFNALNKRGVLVTLNSDDPTIQDTTLTDDFITAIKYYDIDYQSLVDLNVRSLQGSFDSDKETLIKEYKIKVKQFNTSYS